MSRSHSSNVAAFDRSIARAVCELGKQGRRYISSDDVAARVPETPPGVDRRRIGPVLLALKGERLIAPIGYAPMDSRRANCRPQRVWEIISPRSCADWLDRNPPRPDDTPPAQLALPLN